MTGDFAESEKVLREALALRRRVSGENHDEVIWNLSNLARAMMDQKKYEEALKPAEQSLALALRMYGGTHESVMASYNRIGVANYYLKRLDAAEAAFRKAVDTGRKLYGPENRNVASNLNGLGAVLEAAGRLKEAVVVHRESIAVFRKAYGGNHPVLAQSLMTFSTALHQNGDHEEEAAVTKEALEMAAATVGKGSPRYANGSGHYARSRADLGDFEGSVRAYETAIQIRRKTTDEKDETTLGLLVMMAAAGRIAGRCREMEPLLEKAIVMNAGVEEAVQKTQRDEARVQLAACALDRGEDAEVREEGEPVPWDVGSGEAAGLEPRRNGVPGHGLDDADDGREDPPGPPGPEGPPVLAPHHEGLPLRVPVAVEVGEGEAEARGLELPGEAGVGALQVLEDLRSEGIGAPEDLEPRTAEAAGEEPLGALRTERGAALLAGEGDGVHGGCLLSRGSRGPAAQRAAWPGGREREEGGDGRPPEPGGIFHPAGEAGGESAPGEDRREPLPTSHGSRSRGDRRVLGAAGAGSSGKWPCSRNSSREGSRRRRASDR
ncbi:MAG: tetratricopeptide repeat protein [Planctomycetaceae bacterium]|nr:tetratricopeptide repeat protein [Planctomycetaceae bacterium]